MALTLAGCGRSAAAPSDDAHAQAAFDRYRQPERLVAALGLRPGQVVADVGAGQGYLTGRLAAAVRPTGRVVATDIDGDALAVLRARAPSNVSARLVSPSDPGLERATYDLVLLSEVDQYLPDRAEFLARLRSALAPRGRVAVCNRRLYRAPLVQAAARAGFTVVGELPDLPAHFLVLLEAKP
jgi:ubiquinone/menaquinone biosynthesis C-methylase UbiE